MLQVGDEAPDIELSLHTGEVVALSKYRGIKNVVLYFYPKDFTSGCTKEGCIFSSNIEEINRLSAMIIGISADTIESHKAFARDYNLAFPLASDRQKIVCRAYGALWFGGIAIRRVTYVVDKNGIIRGKARHEVHIERHWQYVLKVLREIEGTI